MITVARPTAPLISAAAAVDSALLRTSYIQQPAVVGSIATGFDAIPQLSVFGCYLLDDLSCIYMDDGSRLIFFEGTNG